jgi:DNA-binding NtrC family response regulator
MSSAAYARAASPIALVVSPQPQLRRELVDRLRGYCWQTEEATGGADALARLEQGECHVLLLDDSLPDLNSSEVRMMVQSRFPGVDVLPIEAVRGNSPDAEPQTRHGQQLLGLLLADADGSAAAALPAKIPPANSTGKFAAERGAEPLPGMIGGSRPMMSVYRLTRMVAPRSTPALILGPTGTGKELIARAIHALSPRAARPLVTINCAAIPESLLESELFGYARGAFTGAVQSRVGRIHAAHGGTLFLDEIGDMPLNLQAKLLRFVESGEVQRLGSSDVFRVDVRIIAATNADLERKVAERSFRDDLYYRLSVFPIPLPPLAQRAGDVLLLAEHFLSEFCSGKVRISPPAAEKLLHYSWPGNVRELRHVMERASILAEEGGVIHAEHIVVSLRPDAVA